MESLYRATKSRPQFWAVVAQCQFTARMKICDPRETFYKFPVTSRDVQ